MPSPGVRSAIIPAWQTPNSSLFHACTYRERPRRYTPLLKELVSGAIEQGGEVGASARQQRPNRFRGGAEDPGDLERGHVVLPAKRHGDAPPFGEVGNGLAERLV